MRLPHFLKLSRRVNSAELHLCPKRRLTCQNSTPKATKQRLETPGKLKQKVGPATDTKDPERSKSVLRLMAWKRAHKGRLPEPWHSTLTKNSPNPSPNHGPYYNSCFFGTNLPTSTLGPSKPTRRRQSGLGVRATLVGHSQRRGQRQRGNWHVGEPWGGLLDSRSYLPRTSLP